MENKLYASILNGTNQGQIIRRNKELENKLLNIANLCNEVEEENEYSIDISLIREILTQTDNAIKQIL